MAASAHVLRSFPKFAARSPSPLRAALFGFSWVTFNILVVWVGVIYHHPMICPLLVGGVDGLLFAVIAINAASTRFRGGVTGFLGGVGLNQVDTQTSLITKTADKVHQLVDGMLSTMVENGFHEQIQGSVLRIVWVAVCVIVAALVSEWVWATLTKSDQPSFRRGHHLSHLAEEGNSANL